MLRQLAHSSGAALTRGAAGASLPFPLTQRLSGACAAKLAGSTQLTVLD